MPFQITWTTHNDDACLQSNMYAYPSFSTALASLVRAGPSELFRGFTVSALRDAPYAGIFVVFYENIKQEISQAYV